MESSFFGNSTAAQSSIVGNAYGDFARDPSGPSMSARPGDAPVNTNIVDNAHGDFVRAPPGSSMNARPGYAPDGTNISSNAFDDFGRVPPGPSMNARPGHAPERTNISSNAFDDFNRVPPGPNSTTTAHSWAHQQHPTIGGPHRPQGPFPSEVPKFQIFVISFTDNRNHTFEVRGTETVGQLKSMIETRLGVAKDQQRLTYESKPLENDKMLSQYGIHERSTVHLNARLRGG